MCCGAYRVGYIAHSPPQPHQGPRRLSRRHSQPADVSLTFPRQRSVYSDVDEDAPWTVAFCGVFFAYNRRNGTYCLTHLKGMDVVLLCVSTIIVCVQQARGISGVFNIGGLLWTEGSNKVSLLINMYYVTIYRGIPLRMCVLFNQPRTTKRAKVTLDTPSTVVV